MVACMWHIIANTTSFGWLTVMPCQLKWVTFQKMQQSYGAILLFSCNILIDWLIDWLSVRLAVCLSVCLSVCLCVSVCLSTDWLIDWLIDWLTDWLTDWLIDCLTVTSIPSKRPLEATRLFPKNTTYLIPNMVAWTIFVCTFSFILISISLKYIYLISLGHIWWFYMLVSFGSGKKKHSFLCVYEDCLGWLSLRRSMSEMRCAYDLYPLLSQCALCIML